MTAEPKHIGLNPLDNRPPLTEQNGKVTVVVRSRADWNRIAEFSTREECRR